MKNELRARLIDAIRLHPMQSSKEIHQRVPEMSYPTVKRSLSALLQEKLIIQQGQGKASKYIVSSAYDLFYPIDTDLYFRQEIDDRSIKTRYNFSLITDVLSPVFLFTQDELTHLTQLQKAFCANISQLPESVYQKEMERLSIDLSWKSSQIEGNTYSLLETERLLKEKETTTGKTKDEAVMLLNHKEAMDFLLDNPAYLTPLNVPKIEDIHSLLIKDLGIDRNIRVRRVGITGTNYLPIDNEFQIREALEQMCQLVNQRENIFEKALLLLVLISYIQPFNDGNKRTARIVSNAALIANGYCPLSFRTVDPVVYKKAMLLFYEQNNITAFKTIFIKQFEFAVNTYF